MKARITIERLPRQPDLISLQMDTVIGGRHVSQAEMISGELAAALRLDLWTVLCDWMRRASAEIGASEVARICGPVAGMLPSREAYDEFVRFCADRANRLNRGERADT